MKKENEKTQLSLDRLKQDQERQTKRLSHLIEQLNKQAMNQQKWVPLLEDDA